MPGERENRMMESVRMGIWLERGNCKKWMTWLWRVRKHADMY